MSLAEKDLRVLNRRIVKDVIDRPPDLKRTQPSRLESTLRQDVRKLVRSIFWGFEDIQFQDSFLPSPHSLAGF